MLTHVSLPRNSRLCSAEPTSSPALNLTAVTGRKRKAFPLMHDRFRSEQYLHLSESRSFTPTSLSVGHEVTLGAAIRTFDMAFATGFAKDWVSS